MMMFQLKGFLWLSMIVKAVKQRAVATAINKRCLDFSCLAIPVFLIGAPISAYANIFSRFKLARD